MESNPEIPIQNALLDLLKKHYAEPAQLLIDLLENGVFGLVPFELEIDGVLLSILEEDPKLEEKMHEFLRRLVEKIEQKSQPKSPETESKNPTIESTMRKVRAAVSDVISGINDQKAPRYKTEDQLFFEKTYGIYPEFAEECVDLFHELWNVFCIDFASEGSIIFPKDFQENDGRGALECIRRNFLTILYEMRPHLTVDVYARSEELKTILSQGTLQEKIEKIQKLFEDIIEEFFVNKRNDFYQHFFCIPSPQYDLQEMEANLWGTAFNVVHLHKIHLLPEWEKKEKSLKQRPSLHLRVLGLIQIMNWLMTE